MCPFGGNSPRTAGLLPSSPLFPTFHYWVSPSCHNGGAVCMPFKCFPLGGILALRAHCAHCALLLGYVPPEEPLGTPLGNTLRIRRPKVDWRGP